MSTPDPIALAADLFHKFSVPVALENRLSGDGEPVVRIALIDVDPNNARTVADEAVEMMVDQCDGIPFEIVVFDREQKTSEVSRLRAQAAHLAALFSLITPSDIELRSSRPRRARPPYQMVDSDWSHSNALGSAEVQVA